MKCTELLMESTLIMFIMLCNLQHVRAGIGNDLHLSYILDMLQMNY